GKFDSLNRTVSIRVTDNGIGIEPDEIGRIFDVFRSSKGQKGTGLGLAVAKKIVTEHGGEIRAESTRGEGTTFTVTLPTQPGKTASPDDTHTS
ncbi:MAG: HAMP domain-containing histidine kinase, partial [Sedimentisphaerales bacterium]|nr:HAMP domain-containing histidine kinase [Sedimentisphaerales bacterium]